MFIRGEMAFCLFYWALSRVNTLTPGMDALSEISIRRFRRRPGPLAAHVNTPASTFWLFFQMRLNAAGAFVSSWRTCGPSVHMGRGARGCPIRRALFSASVRECAAVKWGIRAACHLSLGIALVCVDSVSTLGLSVPIQTWPISFSAWQPMLMDISSSPSQCPSLGAGCIPGAS